MVDFLRNPQEYTAVGAGKIPKGVILVGPHRQTGKLYLQRPVAGEARRSVFLHLGSDFF